MKMMRVKLKLFRRLVVMTFDVQRLIAKVVALPSMDVMLNALSLKATNILQRKQVTLKLSGISELNLYGSMAAKAAAEAVELTLLKFKQNVSSKWHLF